MPAADMPAAEVAVDDRLVEALLREQFPDLADLERGAPTWGWDNVLVRLGPELGARLPRRALAAPLVEHEQRWLPSLAPLLPCPVPVPLRVGRPSAALGYPWPWSVVPWLPGEPALGAGVLADPHRLADELGAFLAALHRPAPPDAPANPFRGTPLSARDDATRERIAALGTAVDAVAVRRAWDAALARPDAAGPPTWVHGDVHPGNLLVDADGGLAAVLDFGDLTAGDRSTDLAVAWSLLPRSSRGRFRDAAGADASVDDDCWGRARGWALSVALAILANSADNPPYEALARGTIDAVLSDDAR